MAPQEAELYPRNEEPRDSSPKVQTFRHLVIPLLAHIPSLDICCLKPWQRLSHPHRSARGLLGLSLSSSKDRQCSRAECEREHDDRDIGDCGMQWPADPPDSCFEDPSLFSESQRDASAHQAGESRSQETLQAAPREAAQDLEDLCAQKWPGFCLCCLLESVKSFLSEITNPGAFTAPLLKSTFHSSVSSCLPSA